MRKKYLLLPLLMLAGMTLASCNAEGVVPTIDSGDNGEIVTPWEDYSVPLSGIRIAKDDKVVELNKTETKDISFSIDPKNASLSAVNWSSTDNSVATVTPGNGFSAKITAVGGGECEIVASNESGTITDSAHVTVNVPITDFALDKTTLHLDFTQEADIGVTFTPSDTTYRDLIWTSSNENAVTVSGGHVAAKSVAATGVKIKATSERLNKVLEVTVDVSDDWNYVNTVTCNAPENRYEVDGEFTLTSTVTGIRAADPISTQEKVKYSTSTPELVDVDYSTGKVLAKEAGAAKFKATILDTRSGQEKVSEELTINIFEVKATSIALTTHSKDTVNLDNIDHSILDLSYELTLNDTGATKPSRETVKFSSSNTDVVTVDEDTGKVTVVGKGTARVTVAVIDPRDNSIPTITDYVDVNVTILATKLALTAPKSVVAVGETIKVTATLTPAADKLTDSEVTFSAVPAEKVQITNNNDGTADVKALASGNVAITAYNGELASNQVMLQLKVEFSNDNIYIVGSSDFSSGISVSGSTSWTDAEKAFVLTETALQPTDPENLVKQYKGTVHFSEGDEFKLRTGSKWYDNIVWTAPESGEGDWTCERFVEDAGSVAAGKIILSEAEGEGYGNIKVITEGTYDVYFKTYTDGKYSIYIGDAPVFRFETAPATVKVGEQVVAKVSDWNTSFELSKDNDNVTLGTPDPQGNFLITGVTLGKTVITATDADGSIHYTITVTDKPIAFETGHIYLVGSKDYSTGTSQTGASWGDPTKSFEFTHEVEDASYKKQYKGTITFESGDEFKFRNGPTNEDWLNDLDAEITAVFGDGKKISRASKSDNFVVNTGVTVDIYFKINLDDSMTVSIVGQPELYVDKSAVTVQVGHTEVVTAHDYTGTITATSGDENIATVTRSEGIITISGVAAGTTTITVSDSKKSVQISVTVQSEPVVTVYNLYFTDPWGTGADDMYFYAWKGSVNNHDWPGLKMTFVKLNDYGQGIFKCEVDMTLYDTIIFNANGNQTENIPLNGVTNNTQWYYVGDVLHTTTYSG